MNYLLILGFVVLLVLIWWLIFKKDPSAPAQFPGKWRSILSAKVHFYRSLSAADKTRFEANILAFLDEVTISGVETEVDDTDRLLVASSAVIPLFGFPGWRYRNLNEVLLYKGPFNEDYQTEGKDRHVLGMVGSGSMRRMMILSKQALHQGFDNAHGKRNVGIHEFVHLLDGADGATDGIPEALMQHQYVIPWVKEMAREIREIKAGGSNINPYGAKNQAEFLSVVSEYFFNQPKRLSKDHPELFELLEKMYRQDLANPGYRQAENR